MGPQGRRPIRPATTGKAFLAGVVLLAIVSGWSGDGPRPVAAAPSRDLTKSFSAAVDLIRRHQNAAGYWATAVTPGPQFQPVTTEVNVFTPAVIVDVLDPVARQAGLAGSVAKARAYLRGQIEPTGLARYHGAPGAIDPASRGCELPPDADDTALLWRLAPAADRRLVSAARRELERFRTDSGLYRTWLADERAYRCFYVRYAGREWNPADVAVDMHVYLFLAGHDRAAAARLCDALRRRIDDDAIWVWYTVAPLVPVLREVDLARTRCPVQVPSPRAERLAAGQSAYMTAARLLGRLHARRARPASPSPSLELLANVARDDFAAISAAPPLLYHNDLSAWPPHYHWSEDFGYALWLRLYVETARRWPGLLSVPRS